MSVRQLVEFAIREGKVFINFVTHVADVDIKPTAVEREATHSELMQHAIKFEEFCRNAFAAGLERIDAPEGLVRFIETREREEQERAAAEAEAAQAQNEVLKKAHETLNAASLAQESADQGDSSAPGPMQPTPDMGH